MSRLFSIIVTLFVLFLVYLWIGHITEKEQPVQTRQEPPKEYVRPEPPASQEKSDPGEDIPEEAVEQAAEEAAQPEPQAEPPRPARPATGGHLVIAGNFLERSNAEQHLKTVKGLGYDNAEILQFEISQYYTVCAGRYNDPAEARRVARRMKDLHGIDTYVRGGN